jgi:hypothetical protein
MLAGSASAFRRKTLSFDEIIWKEVVFGVEHVAEVDFGFRNDVWTDVCVDVMYFWNAFAITTDHNMENKPHCC